MPAPRTPWDKTTLLWRTRSASARNEDREKQKFGGLWGPVLGRAEEKKKVERSTHGERSVGIPPSSRPTPRETGARGDKSGEIGNGDENYGSIWSTMAMILSPVRSSTTLLPGKMRKLPRKTWGLNPKRLSANSTRVIPGRNRTRSNRAFHLRPCIYLSFLPPFPAISFVILSFRAGLGVRSLTPLPHCYSSVPPYSSLPRSCFQDLSVE